MTNGHCKHCHQPFAACRYPVSHGVPSIDSIKLPTALNAIAVRYKHGETTANLTSHERNTWDSF